MVWMSCIKRFLLIKILLSLIICIPWLSADAQNFPLQPAPSPQSNDCGCPQQNSDAVSLSGGMFAPFLPSIPNLQLGYQYTFGKYIRTGRFTADYVLPFQLNSNSVLFGEAHAEGWDFWNRKRSGYSTANNRIDLSFGGGYRVMPTENTFFGANAFYDTTRLFEKWYSSGGVGLELASKIVGDDAVDLNFNWYGNLFSKDALVNTFRNGGGSFDIEAGYSHALFNQALDLRFKFAGYRFDAGSPVYGWRTGAELTTRDGVFTAKYEHGSDRFAGPYNTVGGYVNIGFSLENMFRGESPFSKPEAVFGSPRRLVRLLSRPVRRTWESWGARSVSARSDDPASCMGILDSKTFGTISLSNPGHAEGSIDTFTSNSPSILCRACWCGAGIGYGVERIVDLTVLSPLSLGEVKYEFKNKVIANGICRPLYNDTYEQVLVGDTGWWINTVPSSDVLTIGAPGGLSVTCEPL